MSKIDIINQPVIDIDAIKALPGYIDHRIDPEGDGQGGTAHQWLIVDGVEQNVLEQAVASFDVNTIKAKEESEMARQLLNATDSGMGRLVEEIISNTPGLREKLSQFAIARLEQREVARSKII